MGIELAQVSVRAGNKLPIPLLHVGGEDLAEWLRAGDPKRFEFGMLAIASGWGDIEMDVFNGLRAVDDREVVALEPLGRHLREIGTRLDLREGTVHIPTSPAALPVGGVQQAHLAARRLAIDLVEDLRWLTDEATA
jgi:hypothetical protein